MTEHADKLREPFPTNTIKVKPQSVHEDKGLVTFYVDARIVAERLNTVVGADKWEDAYLVITTDPQAGIPVECRLTVEGVTKVDVGQIAPGVIDDKAWKSSYSDAFKRAAVKFGIGAYLYESPNIWAEIKIGRNGKAQGFTDAGKAHALNAYAKWIGDSAPGTGASQVSTAPAPVGGASSGTGDGVGGRAAASSPAKGSAAAPQFTAPAEVAKNSRTGEGGDWTWPFGKHKGTRLEDTPLEYVMWYGEQGTKEDVKQKCNVFLAVPGGGFEPDDEGIPFRSTIDGLGN